jgi:mutator protein MutT
MNAIIEVAIGLIWRDGRLLITQRPPGVHLAELWEFPGGKCEPGETTAACLAREVAEELGIEVAVEQQRETLQFAYPDRHVRLSVFDCRWLRGEPEPRGCAAWRWVTPGELPGYPFPPANAPLIEKLLAGSS